MLVVEDDADTRTMLCMMLEDAGYEVLEAKDGRPVLDILRRHPHGLVVLLDKNMPYVDGQMVLEAIHADPLLTERHAVVLVTAAGVLSRRLIELLVALSVEMIAKPFDTDLLLAAIARAEQKLQPLVGSGNQPA
jgi:CheY-like chemotaxis protein